MTYIKTKKLTTMALFIAVGVILQYIESKIAVTNIPGGKLGICNIVTIINIFMFSGQNAIAIAAIRSLLGAFLFGSAMTVPYSVSGTVFSVLSMWGVQKFLYPKVGIVGMSIVGAVVHNISQLAVAALFYNTVYVFSYLPILLVVALVSGFITGCAAYIFVLRTKGVNL